MTKRFTAPALADLRQDIAGTIPLDLIREWTESKQDAFAQDRILSPYIREGTIVSTDSSGLSRLCKQRPLIEVLKLVSEPKEIIHSYGTALGGEAVGIWTADNTEMFYDGGIETKDVLEYLIAAQREIAALELHIGAGVHSGRFVFLGGGIFGPDADIVETLSEEYTEGGEIAVTPAVRKQLETGSCGLRFEDKGLSDWNAYRCNYDDAPVGAVRGKNNRYPFPFNMEFFNFLRQYESFDAAETQRILSKYAIDSVVVLVKVHHKATEYLLQQLSQWVIANAMIKEIAGEDRIRTIKTNGSLGIFLTQDPIQALEFAQDLKTAFSTNDYEYNIGIASGEVLVLPMDGRDAATEIAGEPVNIASKIAEDIEQRNSIYIDESTAAFVKSAVPCDPFRLTVSHVAINGIRVK